MLNAMLIIDEKHAQILKYLHQLIADHYEPNADIETDNTDTKSDTTDQQLQEEENDIDKVVFIDDDMDNDEE